MSKLLIFGYGYTANAVARLLPSWEVIGTSRQGARTESAADVIDFAEALEIIPTCSHILSTIAPLAHDPVLERYANAIRTSSATWIGYCSSTGVYGDHQGAWIDETCTPHPQSERGQRRLAAEQAWQALANDMNCSLDIFRIAGIYGPKRNLIGRLMRGEAQHIVKPDHYFSRIHIDDLARVIVAALQHPQAHRIMNVADDMPAPSHEVLRYVVAQLGCPLPRPQTIDQANLSPMAHSFYASNKRIDNQKMKALVGGLQYPNYQRAYDALIQQEKPSIS